ncbi:MAG: hypothetical protein JWN46_971 [Acidimicrobiales bacterium]|nr:hypothetical protein [Acidimicrobiales bacterium]
MTSAERLDPSATSPELPPEVLDQHMITALRALGREPGELLREMVHDFLIEAPLLTIDIERAVEQGSPVAAARAAHRLRGTSGHLGLARLAAVAGDVEGAALTGGPLVMFTARVRGELTLAVAALHGQIPVPAPSEPRPPAQPAPQSRLDRRRKPKPEALADLITFLLGRSEGEVRSALATHAPWFEPTNIEIAQIVASAAGTSAP